MVSLKRILHPTDFSVCAQGALAYALHLAVRSGAALHVLHVRAGEATRAAPANLMQPDDVDLDIRLRETVNTHLGRLDQATVDALHIEYSFGQDVAAAPAITRYAERHRIDLIVIGTHGRRGVRRLLLGSVATEVLHTSRCDVMTVRACRDTERVPEPQWGHHILVPLDLTESSTAILREAGAIADLLGGRLNLLHVIDADLVPASVEPAESLETPMPDIRQVVLDRLAQCLEETDRVDTNPECLVEAGSPAMIIVDVASERAHDLIVMASRGPRAARLFSLGSTTERVVRSARCPVWVMKAPVSEVVPLTEGQSQATA